MFDLLRLNHATRLIKILRLLREPRANHINSPDRVIVWSAQQLDLQVQSAASISPTISVVPGQMDPGSSDHTDP